MRQLSFAGIDVAEITLAKARKAMKQAIAKAAERKPRVAKKKKPLRKARKATPAEAAVQRKRLAGQCLKIYERLQHGTATNVELAEISLKYTSRISDIRKAGYPVDLVGHDHETGLTTYQLREPCSPSN